MITDPIVEEVRKVRKNILQSFDNDIDKYIAYLMKQQEKHKDRLVTKEMLDKERAEENVVFRRK